MTKLVIFDCDGVLVDSETLASRVMAEMVAGLGHDMDEQEALRRFRGRKVAECVAEVESLLGRPVPEGFIPDFRDRCAELFESELTLVPHVVEVLDGLLLPCCVASSSPLDKIELVLGLTGLLGRFEERIFSAYELGVWKPDPGLFLHAARTLGTSPADCAVVEDSEVGVQAAVAAGMTVFGYAPDSKQAELLARAGARVFADMRELPLLLAAWTSQTQETRSVPLADEHTGPGVVYLSVLEKLQATNPEAEIWLDSTPAVFGIWAERHLESAPASKQEAWKGQLRRFLDLEKPEHSLIRGVTTNPNLITHGVLSMPDYWSATVKSLIDRHPRADVETIYWLMYQDAVRLSANALMPMWTATKGRHGWVSGQLDPRWMFDAKRMTDRGMDLARLAPNVMVKVPGTPQGYEAIQRLTARGISTNGTFSYTVPQFLACIRAVEAGLAEARQADVPLDRWRSVITHMIGRFGAQGDLIEQAERRGITLDERDVRWAEIAILKRIQRLIDENGWPVKMLLSSLKMDSGSKGAGFCWHLEKTAGTPIVYTCALPFVAQTMEREAELASFDPQARHEDVPGDVLDRLLRIPYFAHSYHPQGLQPNEFPHHGAFIATANESALSARRMVDFVAHQFQALGHGTLSRQLAAAE